ncbi:hypothetical protein XACJM35_870004 [Xanthomonas citri pv. citri]|nr:hypothetical protein XACJM35_870004 [Xanthomonas citri pv. citri]
MQQAEQFRGRQRYADALAIYERVLHADPRDRGAYTMRALTLSDLGSAQLAAEAMWRHPNWFSQQERERLDNDRVARMIGWASAEPVDATHRYAETDQALANAARIQRDAPPQAAWEATRLRVEPGRAQSTPAAPRCDRQLSGAACRRRRCAGIRAADGGRFADGAAPPCRSGKRASSSIAALTERLQYAIAAGLRIAGAGTLRRSNAAIRIPGRHASPMAAPGRCHQRLRKLGPLQRRYRAGYRTFCGQR